MKRLIYGIFLISSLFANDIQVFTANSMHLKLDNTVKIEKLFFGTAKEFNKNRHKIYSSDFVKRASLAGGLSVSAAAAANMGSLKGLDSSGGLVGVAAIGVATVSIIAYDWVVSDNAYVLASVATNKDGVKTMLETLVISNYSLDLAEAEKIALKNQKN